MGTPGAVILNSQDNDLIPHGAQNHPNIVYNGIVYTLKSWNLVPNKVLSYNGRSMYYYDFTTAWGETMEIPLNLKLHGRPKNSRIVIWSNYFTGEEYFQVHNTGPPP